MIIVLLLVLGLVFGSFVNAFVWRLHEKESLLEKKKKPTKKQLAELSILKGRSMCVHCHHELAAKDLVPLFSWILLGGKCRYCRKPISWQYPIVEFLTAVLFVVSYLWWPVADYGSHAYAYFAIWLIFLVVFMALAVYDLRWFLLPNKLVFPLIGLAFMQMLALALDRSDWHILVQAGLAVLIISGLFYVLFQVSAGKWIGGGDVKLAVVLGLLAGTPAKAVLVLFFASVIGTIVSLPQVFRSKKGLKVQVPFGPFLLCATLITVLFGTTIVNWYTRLLVG